jgi:hypothetical protein
MGTLFGNKLTMPGRSCPLYRNPLMGAPGPLLLDGRFTDLLHASSDGLAADHGRRASGESSGGAKPGNTRVCSSRRIA